MSIDNQTDRLHRLDALRFVAAVAVMVAHYTFSLDATHVITAPELRPLGAVGRYGYLGVHFFFVISGFVILATAYRVDAIGFFAGRFTRIVPTFAVCAAITAAALAARGEAVSVLTYLANLTFFPQVFGKPYIDGVYWTLTYEVQFYGLMFLLIASGRLRKLVAPLAAAWLVVAIAQSVGVLPGILRHLLMADYAPLFIAGIAAYLWRQTRSTFTLALIAAATIVAIGNEAQHLHEVAAESGIRYNPFVAGAVIAIAPAAVLWAAQAKSARFGPVCYLLGGISYPLYLLHQELGATIVPRLAIGSAGVRIALTAAAILALSTLVFLADDRVRGKLRRRFDRALRHAADRIGLIPARAARQAGAAVPAERAEP